MQNSTYQLASSRQPCMVDFTKGANITCRRWRVLCFCFVACAVPACDECVTMNPSCMAALTMPAGLQWMPSRSMHNVWCCSVSLSAQGFMLQDLCKLQVKTAACRCYDAFHRDCLYQVWDRHNTGPDILSAEGKLGTCVLLDLATTQSPKLQGTAHVLAAKLVTQLQVV